MKNLPFDFVVFDLDGTLVDSLDDIAGSANFARKALGLEPLPREQVRQYVGRGVRKLLEDVFQTSDANLLKRALEIYLDHYEQHLLDETTVYPGVQELLRELQQRNIPMAVLTNKPQRSSEMILEGLELEGYFRWVVGGDREMARKPDPAGLHWLLDKSNTPKCRACLVGDTLIDWETGRSAGVSTVLVSQGFHDHGELEDASPDVLVRSFSELRPYLLP